MNERIIETERLVLRPWRESDAGALYAQASDERGGRRALWPAHTSQEMSAWVIREVFMPNADCYAMELKSTGEAVGCIGLVPAGDEHYSAQPGEREAGYWIGHPYWGQGLTTEALRALVEHYADCSELLSLLITADAANVGSHRVAEKIGFRLVAEYDMEGVRSKAFRRELKKTIS